MDAFSESFENSSTLLIVPALARGIPELASALNIVCGLVTGFDCVSLGPTEFKELFRRNFGVLLHPRDLGILVSRALVLLLLLLAWCCGVVTLWWWWWS